MSASIRETITSALASAGVAGERQSYYSTYIDAVEAALVERGYEQVEAVVEAAKAEGFGQYGREEELYSKVEAALGQTRRPAPEPEPEVASASDLEALFAEDGEESGKKKGKKSKALLNEVLATLQTIATKQAEQDEALTKLKGLAQSRLGVTL